MAKASMPFYAIMLMLSMSAVVWAQEPARVLAALEYDGKSTSTLRYGDLRITLSNLPVASSSGNGHVDHYRLGVDAWYGKRPAFSMHLDHVDESPPYPDPAVKVMWLDRASAMPQVVFTYADAGGKCCNDASIATMDATGHWHVIETGGLLLDFEYEFLDLNGDGTAELVSTWLYRYCLGLCGPSFRGVVVEKLIGRQLRDVTKAEQYRSFVRGRLRAEEDRNGPRGFEEDLHSNSFLWGWVAQKAEVGELSDAWRTMLADYDHSEANFPETLAEHLLSGRYITSREKRLLDLLSASGTVRP